MAKSIKEKVKAKAKAVKEKLKGKAKPCGKCKPCIIAALALFIAGCLTPEQASRSTHNTNGDFEPTVKTEIGAGACSNHVSVVIKIKLGDGAIASADSSGSTESQTQTPTFDISPKTDVRYNDALAAASTASKGVLETLTSAGASAVLELMSSKKTGTVEVTKTDGSTATVECKDGQCSFCSDCTVK